MDIPINTKGNQPYIFTGRTDAEIEAPIIWQLDAKSWLIWKRPWCWERLRAGEGGSRQWDGWLTSLTQWTWVWANSCRWWKTEKPGVLQSMGLQRVGHDYTTEQWHRFPGSSDGKKKKKNLPAIWEIWPLGWEDPLEKGMATHSSMLAWRTPWTEEPGLLKSMVSQRVGHNWVTNTFTLPS